MKHKIYYLENVEIPKECKTNYFAGYSTNRKDTVSSNLKDACFFMNKKSAKRARNKLKSKYKVRKAFLFPIYNPIES